MVSQAFGMMSRIWISRDFRKKTKIKIAGLRAPLSRFLEGALHVSRMNV